MKYAQAIGMRVPTYLELNQLKKLRHHSALKDGFNVEGRAYCERWYWSNYNGYAFCFDEKNTSMSGREGSLRCVCD